MKKCEVAGGRLLHLEPEVVQLAHGVRLSRAQDLVDNAGEEPLAGEELRRSAQANDEANFGLDFDPRLDTAVMDRYDKHEDFIDELLGDEALKGYFFAQIRKQVYARLRSM